MGDRGNIEIVYSNGLKIYFYTHWGGSHLPYTLQDALRRGQGRWEDESYLARIIFSEMIQGEVMEETGYGISPFIQDNEHPIVSVDCKNGRVVIESEQWSFKEYIEKDEF